MASTAHDLMTPLTGMQLSLSLVKKSKDLKEIRDLTNTSLHCAEMMGMIVHRAMALFQDSGKRSFEALSQGDEDEATKFGSVDLRALFNKVESVMRSYPKAVKPVIKFDEGTPKLVLLVKGAETSVYQSALNYLTNACKATKEGEIRRGAKDGRSAATAVYRILHSTITNNLLVASLLAGSIELIVKAENNVLLIECRDTGPGVNQEKISELFVPFSEVNKSTLNGTGLGLFSVASHVHRLGGKYGYRPLVSNDAPEIKGVEKVAKGSIFWFQIPIVTSPLASKRMVNDSNTSLGSLGSNNSGGDSKMSVASSQSSTPTSFQHQSKKTKRAAAKSTAARRTPSALVVDDSVTVRKPLARAISKLGFDVDVASNGLEGLLKMKMKEVRA